MRTRTWKVPTVLLAAALVGACGGEAESAADSGSERVIPAAESPETAVRSVDAGQAAEHMDAVEAREASEAASGQGEAVRPAPGATPEVRAAPESPAPREPSAAETVAPRDEPVSAPPTEVVRSDPEPSLAPAEPMEMRPDPEAAPPPLTAPAGTRVTLTVEEELSTRITRTGDTFAATVAEDVLGGDGVVLLSRGTPVRGRVLESFESPASDRPATLALGVESVELGARLVPVVATVTELQHETEARDSDGRSAAKVGAGAVAGAILGKIIGGDGGDAVKGAVAGALAGAAVAHATRDGHAKVPQGARMVIVLDEPLVVEAPPDGGWRR